MSKTDDGRIAIPLDPIGPARAYVGINGQGWGVFFARNGKDVEWVGSTGHERHGLRQALELCHSLNARGADVL